jgi:hypothetical protein
MPSDVKPPHPVASPHTLEERLQLANQLYQEFHTRCFWHCPPELEISEDLIPFVAHGLRAHGGRRGFILGSRLLGQSADCDARRHN